MTAFHAVTVVWGTEFRDLFVDVCVPNQLSAGNLRALPAGSRYRIFTAPEDSDFLMASSTLRQVSQVLPVDIVPVARLSDPSENRFVKMTACHSQALADAGAQGAALIFLSPDLFMSEGTMEALVRGHRTGHRAVVCVGIRVDRETFVGAVRARAITSLPARDLVALAIEHLHPFAKAHMIDGTRTASRPIGVYWRVPGEGILVRGFYLHPLMVDPLHDEVMPGGTIDQHYLVHACPDRDRIHVVDDSDELVVFEMSPGHAALTETVAGSMSMWRAASVLSRCDDHQRTYWDLPIRLHTADVGETWRPVEDEAARFARCVVWLRPIALWRHLGSRRVRPVLRQARALKKRLRRQAKDLAPWRWRQSAKRIGARTAKAGRRMLRRARLAH